MSTTTRYAAETRHLSRRCAIMKALIRRVGPCLWSPAASEPFPLLVRCVISQQISGKAATSISERLFAAAGRAPVTPRRLANLTEEEMQACGVSTPKRRTLRALAGYALANRGFLPGIPTGDDDTLRTQLESIAGIGPWTVDMFLMFGLGRPDVLSTGDYGIRVGIQRLFELAALPKPAEMQRIAEPWRPFRSVAMWYVWRSLDLDKAKAN